MPRLNMVHFLVAKKIAGDAPDASRAGLIGALSRDPLTAFFAGRAANLQHKVGPARPPAGGGGGEILVLDDEQQKALRGAYREYKDAPNDEKLRKLLDEVGKVLELR